MTPSPPPPPEKITPLTDINSHIQTPPYTYTNLHLFVHISMRVDRW